MLRAILNFESTGGSGIDGVRADGDFDFDVNGMWFFEGGSISCPDAEGSWALVARICGSETMGAASTILIEVSALLVVTESPACDSPDGARSFP